MKVMKVKAAKFCLILCNSRDHTVHGILQSRILEWVAFPFSRGLPNPGIKPWSPTLQVDSLPAEPPGKPKNTGVGSLSLLQWIFPTQESNQGLLHCRQILSQLSYQESPSKMENNAGDWVPSLGWEDPLEKRKATHCSILAWRILWTVESIESQRVGHD